MAEGTLKRQTRKLEGQIDGRDVFVREMLNRDLDETDEAQDEYDELVRQRRDLGAQVEASEDADERRSVRGEVRELAKRIRSMDSTVLGLYVEDGEGNRFSQEQLENTPVAMQTNLMRQAAKRVYGDIEVPTTGQAASS